MSGEHVLVVDDEPSVVEVVGLYLRREGFRVSEAGDGQSALAAIAREMPDLLILDVMLPGVDGLAIITRVRARAEVPIILLTARREEADRILGLELGADDYVVKPFSPRELASRVRAVMRRSRRAAPAEPDPEELRPLMRGAITLEPRRREVTVRKAPQTLTAKEFDLLWFFMRHPRQVFSRSQLLENVWGLTDYIDPGTVTVHVRRLREKIEADPGAPEYIQTVWGVGYKFETQPDPPPAESAPAGEGKAEKKGN